MRNGPSLGNSSMEQHRKERQHREQQHKEQQHRLQQHRQIDGQRQETGRETDKVVIETESENRT